MAKGAVGILNSGGVRGKNIDRRPKREPEMSLITASSGRTAVSIDESREYCATLTKREARNFYYGLKLLPQRKRIAMFALYAYMRLVDDIADGQEGLSIAQRSESLDAWSDATQSALG